MGIVGRVDDAGETGLAAATAAIITARWASASAGHGHAPSRGESNGGSELGNDSLGHDRRGHDRLAHDGLAQGGPAPSGNGQGIGGNGHSHSNGQHQAPGGPGDWAQPTSPAPGGYGDWAQPTSAAPGGYGDWPPPSSPAPGGFDLPDPGGDRGIGRGDAGMAFPPAAPAEAHVEAPTVPGASGIGFAAASFFAAARPEPVPEVFGTRIPGQRGPDPISGDVGSVISDLSFPEPLDPGFNAFEPVARPAEPAVEQNPSDQSESRSHVPPGFERRTFGPFPDEPDHTDSGQGGPGLGGVGHGGYDEPRSFDPGPAPSALGAFAPPPVLPPLPSPGSLAMPPTFAPPEPAPWTDAGWTEFSRPDLDREAELVGVVAGTPLLPRRVPQSPDVPDFALFDGDPSLDPAADGLELDRIATFLRDDEQAPASGPRPDGFDVALVLEAVRGVRDVRDAQLRWNASAGHTLRIEFVDGADEGEVTRAVVRLLREQMGLGAAPSSAGSRLSGNEATMDRPPNRPRTVASARVPMRAQPAPNVTAGLPLARPSGVDIPRLELDNVTVTRLGAEATVEVRLSGPGRVQAVGVGRGPGVDAYLSRLAATAAAHAANEAIVGRGKAFVEHVSVVPFGVVEVAVVVLLLSYEGQNEQLSGSAIVGDDPHQAVVRATLAALNRRLESLLS